MATIGFIGLGNMGAPMAANLLRAGHQVRGYDIAPNSAEIAANLGIDLAGSAQDAVRGADTVITMLPAGRHVSASYADILPAASPGTLFIDCSTIDVASARAAHASAADAGMASVDAPVSGGVGGATAATLTFMAGGAEAAIGRAEPILRAMGKRVVNCGGPGAGQMAKICNNMILGISMIAVSEAFVLGEKLGLSPQALFDVASTSSGQCWALNLGCPVPGPVPTSPANRDFAPGFAAGLMLKDLTLAQEAARAVGAHTALGAHAQEIYTKFAEHHAGLDFSAVIKAVREG
jgi:3-hydroxyisobutyrate dehydrogenase